MESRLPWLTILGLHVLWFFVLPTKAGEAVAAVGALTAAAVLLRGGRTSRPAEGASGAARTRADWRHLMLVAPFLTPILSLAGTPHVAFLRLDGRVWLIAAWLGTAIWNRALPPHHGTVSRWRIPTSAGLVLLWSTIFWLALVWDAGAGAYILQANRTTPRACQSDPLAVAFSIWETHPASEHLFLGWRSYQAFELREPYANHVHPYLLTMYAWTRAVRMLAGVPTFVATNTTPLLLVVALVMAAATLLARLGLLAPPRTSIDLLVLFIACGLLVTSWRLWADFYRYNSDNPYPLLGALLVLVYSFLVVPARPSALVVSASVFAAVSPTYTPMLLVAMGFLFGTPGRGLRDVIDRNRPLIAAGLGAVTAGVIAYLTPRALIAFKHYTPEASTLLFRSGLDGDTTYFMNMLQALVSPCSSRCCGGRPFFDLAFPAFVPLLIMLALVWRDATVRGRLLHLLFFLCIPYVCSLVLFPQSVSIHPYLYDHLLLVPATIAAVVAMAGPTFKAWLDGPRLLAFLLAMTAVLMSNLLEITQTFARLPR